ncbi:MAG: hypothetical protein EOP49_30850 [Sphingobacteriales bacterium]|nr:MAG: hypothetical protein EOP49_30850 [Sphingobacteriales bacterium]
MTGADGEPGINGGLMKKQAPGQPVPNAISVDDIDTCLEQITRNGGHGSGAEDGCSKHGMDSVLQRSRWEHSWSLAGK